MNSVDRCIIYNKPNQFKLKLQLSSNTNNIKLRSYVKSLENLNTSIKQYKNYMYCKYQKNLCQLAIEYRKINILKWALDNEFYYYEKDCAIAINNNFPEALEAMLEKNSEDGLLKPRVESSESKDSPTLSNIFTDDTTGIIKRLIDRINNPGQHNTSINNGDKKILLAILNKYL